MATDSGIEIKATLAAKVNYAVAQWMSDTRRGNLLSQLQIDNESGKPLTNCKLKVWSQPPFITSRNWNIDTIEAGQTFDISDLQLQLDSGFLWGVSEAINGTAYFELSAAETEPISQSYPVRVLSHTEWAGRNQPMELLAAHVLPNDPQVAKILKVASAELSKAGKNPALNGYQSHSPRRVVELMVAVWNAVRDLNLTYAEPPASFEEIGQKIRTPSQIVQEGLATCLDTATLFAACLEQAGIHPLVVTCQNEHGGHAFTGAWFKEDGSFDKVVTLDSSALQKSVVLREALYFETTLVRDSKASFQEAVSDRPIPSTVWAVDVKQTRLLGVTPIPSPGAVNIASDLDEVNHGKGLQNADWLSQFSDGTSAPDVAINTASVPSISRLNEWQKRLLDLTQRNSLLNFKSGKRSISISCPDAGKLEDILAAGERLQVLPEPEETADDKQTEYYASEILKDNKLIATGITQNDLDSRMLELMRSGKRDLEEGGANTLFLALGFLVWKDDKRRSTESSRAPLILIPVALDRKSAKSKIILSGLDEETRFNATLLQLLEQDFGIRIPELEGELPKDDHGLDVERIYQIVTNAVRNFEGWQVIGEAAISSFSFARYLMWKDLKDQGDLLKQNALVKHLVDTPLLEYKSKVPFPQTHKLDEEYPPDKVFMPLPADSSQMTAALAAAAGKDFVLFGPPGTGKSQSIANMISHCMAEGKKVLFVSAKKAALDVVYRRLRQVGLDDFCLEVHSSKDSNRNAYEQLKHAAARSHDAAPDGDWNRETAQLLAQINELNNYVQHLHREYPNGLSAYRAMGKLLTSDDLPRIELKWQSPDQHTRDDYEKMRAAAQSLMLAFPQNLDQQTQKVLASVHLTDWSPSIETQFSETTQNAAMLLRLFDQKRTEFINTLLPESASNEIASNSAACTALLKIAQLLLEHDESTKVLFTNDAKTLKAEIDSAQQTLATLKNEWSALSCEYIEDSAATLNVDDLQNDWREAAALMWPRRHFAQSAVERTLQTATAAGQKPDAAQDILHLQKWQKARQMLAAFNHLGKSTYGLWRGVDTDITELQNGIEKAITLGDKIGDLIKQCASNDSTIETLQNAVATILQNEGSAPMETAAREFVNSYHELQPYLKNLNGTLNAPFHTLIDSSKSGWIGELATKCEAWQKAASHLRTWSKWQAEKQNAEQLKLAPLVEALGNDVIQPAQSAASFEINYLRWWLRSVIDADAVLHSFSGREQDFTVTAFVKNVDDYLQLTRRYIRARIAAHHQSPTSQQDDEAMGLLTRELKKKMRFKPLRKMMSQASSAVLRLTPCMMMSPLSVAQFLALGEQHFDVVIFDEASQIPVWDSIGALARAKQAVIAGDPKQMPPTDFFSRGTDEEDADNDLQSAESILDECRSVRVPELYLDWHYRSRHENLIAFSNHHYYDDRLITFPAPQTKDSSVSFHYVADGIYASGKARHNQNEAKAVVADIVAHLKAPLVNGKKLTVGVVTFNSQQQKLIEDLLEAERRADPSLEQWFASDNMEPVMVKNLENVQGDERDIMYFSVTFGPSPEGRIMMNFGPLNKDGGERRLNVAITRARDQLKIFSSLRPDQIDLSRTGSLGVKDFKHFLEFAQLGTASFAREADVTGHSFDSCFEEAVSYALEKRGWRVQSQVGVAKFRIDLGVVHPAYPGKYLAGVECDGATYHSAATARDRDKVREGVLRGLGWNILRVWSTDWWENPEAIADQLDAELKELQQQTPQPVAERVPTPPEIQLAPESNTNENHQDAAKVLIPQEPISAPISTFTKVPNRTAETSVTLLKGNVSTSTTDSPQPVLATYKVTDFASMEIQPDANQFYDAGYNADLLTLIENVVAQEAPIFEELLIKRIARAHGFSRAGGRIQKRIRTLLKGKFHLSPDADEKVYWPSKEAYENWNTFREPGEAESRAVDEIPMDELCVLANLVSAQEADPENQLRQMAKHCGISRVGDNVRTRFTTALHH